MLDVLSSATQTENEAAGRAGEGGEGAGGGVGGAGGGQSGRLPVQGNPPTPGWLEGGGEICHQCGIDIVFTNSR